MRASHYLVRLLALLLAGLALGACATQPSNEVRVGVGMLMPEPAPVRDYAALYLPYAMMATAAYTDKDGLNGHQCPDRGRLAAAPPGESPSDAERRLTVRAWIGELGARGWHCEFGVTGHLDCPKRIPNCKPVDGLEFHVWRRNVGGQCREVAIAFRGSDPNDIGDWVSNFRWLNRLAPKFDQYYQVQTHIKQIVQDVRSHGCGAAGTQFVSTGHSLGGGLAQQAAYADDSGSIKYVYGFDPSPVTGFFDVSDLVLKHSTPGLGVDRAYEQGEILMLPRLLIENIIPPPDCNPRIRSVRFNLLTGLPVDQHNIAKLTQKLQVTARQTGANPRRVFDGPRARGCQGSPMMLPPA
jgi:hypothetical protein